MAQRTDNLREEVAWKEGQKNVWLLWRCTDNTGKCEDNGSMKLCRGGRGGRGADADT